MSEQLDAELLLDVADAMSRVEDVGTSLEEVLVSAVASLSEALDDALAAPPVVMIEGDASALPGDVEDSLSGTEPVVPVEADTSAAEGSLGELEATASDLQPVVEVEADTDAAQASIDDLADSASGAGAAASESASGMGELGVAAGLATGNVKPLGQELAKAPGALGAVAAGTLGAAAAFGVFFTAGMKSVAGTERLQVVFGGMAKSVQQIDVGGLSGDMSELAKQSGNSGAQLRAAAAGLGQIAISSGASKQEAKGFAQEVSALALRATALNPALGEAGAVATRMTTALARGGKFAAAFGLSLTPAAINAKALAMTGKESASELDIFEKSAAGAALATEQLGNKLGSDFQRGSQQSAVQLKALKAEVMATVAEMGKPLVPVMLDIFEDLVPVAQSLATVLGSMAQSVLPAIAAAVEGIAPLLQTFGDLLTTLPAPITGAAVASLGLGRAMGGWGYAIGAVLPLLSALDPALASAAVSIGGMAFAGGKLATVIPGMSTGMGVAAGAGIGLGQAIGGTAGNAVSLISAGALLGSVIPGVGTAAGAAVGGVAALGMAVFSSGQSASEARAEIQKLAGELDKLSTNKATRRFVEDEIDVLQVVQERYGDLEQDIKDLAEASPAAAARIVEGLRAQNDTLQITDEEFKKLHAIVGEGTKQYQENAKAAKETSDKNNELAGSATKVSDAEAAATAQTQAFSDKVKELSSSVTATLPTAGGIVQTFVQDVHSAFGETATPSIEDFVKHLQDTVASTQVFVDGVTGLMQAGLTGLAGVVQAAGPEVGSAWIQQLAALPEGTRQQLDAAIRQGSASLAQFQYLLGRYGADSAAAMLAGLQPIPADVQAAMNAATGAVNGANLPGTTGAVATNAAGAFGAGIGSIPGQAAGVGNTTNATLAAWTVAGTMSTIGTAAGTNFIQAMEYALTSNSWKVEDAAREVVRAVARAAGNAGSPSEHLFRDEALTWGDAMAEGLTSSTSAVKNAAQEVVRSAARGLPEAPVSRVAAAPGGATADELAASLGRVLAGLSGGNPSIHVEGVTDPVLAATLVGREQAYQRRLAGV